MMEEQQPTEHLSHQVVTSSPMTEVNPGGKKKGKKKLILLVLLVLTLASLGAAGYLWWQLMTANQDISKLNDDKQTLQSKIDSLTAQLTEAQKQASSGGSNGVQPCDPEISVDMMNNMKDAIGSRNYSALLDYMADKVSVIVAASEGIGDRTPAEAVKDLEYFNNAQGPWSFSLPPATIDKYENGFYKSYFDKNTYVGRSADKMVVSFDFDKCGQISSIFMVADESLLTE